MNPLIRVDPTTAGSDSDPDLSATLASQLGSLAQSLAMHPEKPRAIALVATGRREGATSCTVSLGRYLARRRARVLMVDANCYHPALHALCAVEQEDGLQDVMARGRKVVDAIKPTSVSGLFVLTGGSTSNGQAPVTSSILRDGILAATRDFDFVLVDCAAVNAYEGSAMLASVCDGTILVVEGGRTLRQSAKAAKQLLTRANCHVLGVFINKRRYYIPQFLYDRL